MRQTSRRSWRIGLSRPVKVVFMAYRNNLQADALKLVAKKTPAVPSSGRSKSSYKSGGKWEGAKGH